MHLMQQIHSDRWLTVSHGCHHLGSGLRGGWLSLGSSLPTGPSSTGTAPRFHASRAIFVAERCTRGVA